MPLTVNFSSAGSLDQDPGDSIRYEWDFGDGSPISEEANPTHTYTQAGQYTAVLTVIDSTGKRTSTSTIITAGNNAPTITIKTPIEGGTFNFGDKIPYAVEVTDDEDKVIDCQDVEVEFILGHDEHGHGEEEKLGCSGFLNTLEEDVSHGGNVFGVISASYTDRGNGAAPGISVTKQVKIRQRKQEIEHSLQTQWSAHPHERRGRRTPHGQPRHQLGQQPRVAAAERSVQPARTSTASRSATRIRRRAAARVCPAPRWATSMLRTGSQNGPIVGDVPADGHRQPVRG